MKYKLSNFDNCPYRFSTLISVFKSGNCKI